MHAVDRHLTTGLTRMQRAYDALLSERGAAIDRYNIKKTALDEEWQAELEPIMRDLYWYPFRNGLDEAPAGKRELRQWLKRKYSDDAAVIVVLLLLLQRYHRRAANLGGQTALDTLDIDAAFNLTNADYLQVMIDRAQMLVTQGSEQSLIDTTIDDLTEAVTAARKVETGILLALSAYIATRAAQRTVLIERYERPWAVNNALQWTQQNNGIRYHMYDVNGVGCVKICAEWHGRVFPLGGAPVRLPQHSGCDCIWSTVRYDGQVVGMPPVTVSVPGLPPWQPPALPWTGGSNP